MALDRQLAEVAKAHVLAASRRRYEATRALQEAVQRSLELALRPQLFDCPQIDKRQAVDEAAEQSFQTMELVVEQQAAMERRLIVEATDPRGREYARCPQVRS